MKLWQFDMSAYATVIYIYIYIKYAFLLLYSHIALSGYAIYMLDVCATLNDSY